jgi:hypothetical protein
MSTVHTEYNEIFKKKPTAAELLILQVGQTEVRPLMFHKLGQILQKFSLESVSLERILEREMVEQVGRWIVVFVHSFFMQAAAQVCMPTLHAAMSADQMRQIRVSIRPLAQLTCPPNYLQCAYCWATKAVV